MNTINREYKRITKKGGYTRGLNLIYELGYSHIYNRLAELEDKIENGTLVELPCKVGDTVYEVLSIHHGTPFIKESMIEKIIITLKGLRIKLSRNTMYETSISSLGKTIFLTREEAEKALAERSKK